MTLRTVFLDISPFIFHFIIVIIIIFIGGVGVGGRRGLGGGVQGDDVVHLHGAPGDGHVGPRPLVASLVVAAACGRSGYPADPAAHSRCAIASTAIAVAVGGLSGAAQHHLALHDAILHSHLAVPISLQVTKGVCVLLSE